jgi:GT2 family glycosyltransferase
MGISIIVVNFNGAKYLEAFFDSIHAAFRGFTGPYEILVYDNNSSDESVKILKDYAAKDPRVSLYSNNDNIGFARGNNYLVKKARFENLLLINNDTKIIDISSILQFVGRQKELKNEVISCRTLNPDLSIQQNVFTQPGIFRLLVQLFLLKSVLKKIFPTGAGSNQGSSKQYFSGCFLLMSKTSYIKVNGFDEDYFFYHEEADLFLKLENIPADKLYFDDSSIIHYGGGGGPITEFSFRNYFLSLFILYHKHYFSTKKSLLYLLFQAGFLFRFLLIRMRIPFNASPLSTIYRGQSARDTDFKFLSAIHKNTMLEIKKYHENISNNRML